MRRWISVGALALGLLGVATPAAGLSDPLIVRFAGSDAPTVSEEGQMARYGEGMRAVATQFRKNAIFASVVELNEDRAEAAAAAAEARQRRERRPVVRSAPTMPDSGGRHYSCPQFASANNPTGDFAVPCYIVDRESDGNYTVPNGQGSSACGTYQIMADTWNGYGGYSSACDAPAWVQDEKARSMPLCHWEPPNYCA